jgi:hypothetical protein
MSRILHDAKNSANVCGTTSKLQGTFRRHRGVLKWTVDNKTPPFSEDIWTWLRFYMRSWLLYWDLSPPPSSRREQPIVERFTATKVGNWSVMILKSRARQDTCFLKPASIRIPMYPFVTSLQVHRKSRQFFRMQQDFIEVHYHQVRRLSSLLSTIWFRWLPYLPELCVFERLSWVDTHTTSSKQIPSDHHTSMPGRLSTLPTL